MKLITLMVYLFGVLLCSTLSYAHFPSKVILSFAYIVTRPRNSDKN